MYISIYIYMHILIRFCLHDGLGRIVGLFSMLGGSNYSNDLCLIDAQ